MARNRSTALIAVGAAVFVVGAALTFLVVRDDKGDTVTASAPAATSTVAGAQPAAGVPAPVKVPSGKEAVAIQVPTIPGLAGYAKVDDVVNVYGTFKEHQPNAAVKGAPLAKLVLPGAQVLAVTAPAPGAEAGNTTYLLAVNPGDAERVIYLASYESIWMSLSPAGAPNLGSTPGHNAQNIA